MEKYPLSLMRQSLIEWKYRRKYSHEVKTFDVKDKQNGELEIMVQNKIRIVNNAGSFNVQVEPVKFSTNSTDLASFSNEEENEKLKNFLSDFDNSVYTQAQDNESNTAHHGRFFER